MRQTWSMEDYIQRFECLMSEVPKLHHEQYFAYFIHGLHEEIRA